MNTQYVKGDSIFNRINPCIKQYPYLTTNITTDVIIVGGGVTGALLSYYFGKNGISSVVLEGGRVAHGSTGVTTSLLQYELDSNAGELSQYTSIDNVIKSYNLGIKALDEIHEFVRSYGNSFDYTPSSNLLYTSNKSDAKEIINEYEFRRSHSLPVELITPDNNPFSFHVEAGVIAKDGGIQIDPYKYTHALLNASTSLGGKVFENSQVVKVEYTEDGVIAHTVYDYMVSGKKIIVATGFNTSLFTDRVFGIKTTTFNIATYPINELDELYKGLNIRDNKDPYNYIRSTVDNRLIIGGEDINFFPDINNEDLCTKKYGILEQRLKDLFPDYNIDIEYRYCGAFASTQDNLGFIGPDPKHKNLWYCLGYGANGILFAILGSMMLTSLYKGETPEYMDLFRVNRFDN
ncbi:MAG: FAD-dependent oxidoreductase [Clostridium sp.]